MLENDTVGQHSLSTATSPWLTFYLPLRDKSKKTCVDLRASTNDISRGSTDQAKNKLAATQTKIERSVWQTSQ